MAQEAPQGSDPQTVGQLRSWCRLTRKELRDAIDSYDEGSWAGIDPVDLGPHPVEDAVTNAANYLADLGNFNLAQQLTAAAGRGIDQQEALSLLMQVEQWCIKVN